MTLTSGTRLGPYEVLAPLGEGGMGEVYRARDTQLKRDVALKVLPAAVAADPERLARFQREAELLAALNHPHIAQIYGLAEADRVRALVMELVDGPTLAERIAQGAVPIAEALPIARQLADALDEAHERGIVHRDLKPANIKLTPAGAVKVLDFGLAKALSADTAAEAAGLSTMTSPAQTQAGIILGTAAYMSPEQARGKVVDKRADIWAFGIVLYEMLTGAKSFPGDTITDVLGAIVHKEPDWTALPRDVPARVRALMEHCLQKDPRARLRDIGDATVALGPAAEPETPASSRWWPPERRALLMGAAAGAVIIAAALLPLLLRSGASMEPTETLRLTIDPPPGTRFDVVNWAAPELTPDGRSIIVAARGPDGSHLWVRDLDSFEFELLPGTNDALPTSSVSPDGQRVVFATIGSEVRRVAVRGASKAELVGPSPDWFGGSMWGSQSILFVGSRAVSEVAEAGGQWRAIPGAADPGSGERIVGWARSPAGVVVLSVNTGPNTRIAAIDHDGRRHWIEGLTGIVRAFVPPDEVLVFQDRFVLVKLDLKSFQVRGTRAPLIQAPDTRVAVGGDTVAYFDMQRGKGRRLVWVDRDGSSSPIQVEAGEYRAPRLSPDGRRVAVYGATATSELAVMTINLQSGERIVVPGEMAVSPTWDAQSSALVFAAGVDLPQRILRWNATGSAEPEPFGTTVMRSAPLTWLANGDVLLEVLNPSQDISVMKNGGKVQPLLDRSYVERSPMISPDGKWLAYMSNESDRYEVYVQPWPAVDRKYVVSREGGTEPVWSRNSPELFFRRGGSIYSVRYTTTPEFRAEAPVRLFDASRFSADPYGDPSFDVDPKGRFLMIEDDPDARIELRVELHAFRPRAGGGK